MTSKKYVLIISGVLCASILVHALLWHGYTKKLFFQRDLTRLVSFVQSEASIHKAEYSRHHTEFKDYLNSGRKESFDVITIGDSFCNGGGANYFQDYLEDKYGLRVLNFRIKNNCLVDLYLLLQSGFLDEIKPEAVIIESVGRYVWDRMKEKPIIPQTSRSDIVQQLKPKDSTKTSRTSGLLPFIMLNANKNLIENILYSFSHPENLSPKTYINELDRDFFSNKGQGNILLFYHQDLDYIYDSINAAIISSNLNDAAKLLQDRNITLIFMPCVDKYDLYYPYIKDKRGRPENNLFSEIQNVPDKNYIYINTKAILREALSRGEKDLYWLNDTHWSWKGYQFVCDELVKYIKPR